MRVRFVSVCADPKKGGTGVTALGVVIGHEGEHWNDLSHLGNTLIYYLDGKIQIDPASVPVWTLTEINEQEIPSEIRSAILLRALKHIGY